MQQLAWLIKWIILLPILVVIALLAVANDQTVALRLNPFDADDPVLRVELALYQVAFAAFALGAICGGIVMWNGQRKYRRQAREKRHEAAALQARADKAERQAHQNAGLLAGPAPRA
ncbi:lipopolysaccharide assembly protein LapA domain-containing protein [Afifella sp. H1R]|uniref:lipopolysaccharide assembly protein LapA domain-containing protein n=1 Tax=unclassified Afifella TaxID=2624128 RepID=UPI001F34688B|nr:LapA family protein [Afifella sp. H1R]MCF1505068.1 LapA family protein [Afifella sp. H1R]